MDQQIQHGEGAEEHMGLWQNMGLFLKISEEGRSFMPQGWVVYRAAFQ